MTLLAKQKYRRWQVGPYSLWCGKVFDDQLCDRGLREFFELPNAVTTIWIGLHDQWTKNRVRIVIEKSEYIPDRPSISIGEECLPIRGWVIHAHRKPLSRILGNRLKRIVWAEVEYLQ